MFMCIEFLCMIEIGLFISLILVIEVIGIKMLYFEVKVKFLILVIEFVKLFFWWIIIGVCEIFVGIIFIIKSFKVDFKNLENLLLVIFIFVIVFLLGVIYK